MQGVTDFFFVFVNKCTVQMTITGVNGYLYGIFNLSRFGLTTKRIKQKAKLLSQLIRFSDITFYKSTDNVVS